MICCWDGPPDRVQTQFFVNTFGLLCIFFFYIRGRMHVCTLEGRFSLWHTFDT